MKNINGIIIKSFVCGLTVLFIVLSAGCVGENQLNPYELAAEVNSIDNTGFFNTAYQAFQSVDTGSSSTDTDSSEEDDSSTVDYSSLLSQYGY